MPRAQHPVATTAGVVVVLLWTLVAPKADAGSPDDISSSVPPEGPWLSAMDPAPNSESVRFPLVTVTFASLENPVDVTSVRLFQGTNQLGPLVFAPVEGGIQVRSYVAAYSPLGSTQVMTVVFRGQHPASATVTSTWAFYVGPIKDGGRSLFVEAEDFNYSNDGVTGGLYANFGDPDCSLTNKTDIPGIDYFQTQRARSQRCALLSCHYGR